MTHVYLLAFEAGEIAPEQRHALKDVLGRVTRIALDPETAHLNHLLWQIQNVEPAAPPVAIDHLDADEPTVRALLVD